MKKIFKATMAMLTIAVTASISSVTASAATSNNYYYYDVKKAGDYVLNYCNAYGLPKGRLERFNDNFERLPSDCTNFVSQILYYGGYRMRGTPSFLKSFPATTLNAPYVKLTSTDWYYYKVKDSNGTERDEWTTTWTLVDGTRNLSIFHDGIDDYFTGHDVNVTMFTPDYLQSHLCDCSDNLSYSDVVELATITDAEAQKKGKHKLHRGDIIQLKDCYKLGYEHSVFVWCTEPEIRVSSHTDDYLAKPLSAIEFDTQTGEQKNKNYRIIHTTDHAIAKSAW